MAVRGELTIGDVDAGPAVVGQPDIGPGMAGGVFGLGVQVAADIAGRHAQASHAGQEQMGMVLSYAVAQRQHLAARRGPAIGIASLWERVFLYFFISVVLLPFKN